MHNMNIDNLEICLKFAKANAWNVSERGDLTPPPPFSLSTYSEIKLPERNTVERLEEKKHYIKSKL